MGIRGDWLIGDPTPTQNRCLGSLHPRGKRERPDFEERNEIKRSVRYFGRGTISFLLEDLDLNGTLQLL